MVHGQRRRVGLAAAGLAELVVIAVAFKEPTGGGVNVVAALFLAPLAVLVVSRAAARLANGWFPPIAAMVYAVLPLAANRFLLPTYRPIFDRHALPALVGLQSSWALALGIAATAAVAFLPRRIVLAASLALLVAGVVVWGFGSVGDLQPRLHETAWSVALAEWLVVASIVGAVLRSPAIGAGLGTILVAAILRGAHQPYDDGSFWRSLAFAAPSAAVLLSSLGLLVPRLRGARRTPETAQPSAN